MKKYHNINYILFKYALVFTSAFFLINVSNFKTIVLKNFKNILTTDLIDNNYNEGINPNYHSRNTRTNIYDYSKYDVNFYNVINELKNYNINNNDENQYISISSNNIKDISYIIYERDNIIEALYIIERSDLFDENIKYN